MKKPILQQFQEAKYFIKIDFDFEVESSTSSSLMWEDGEMEEAAEFYEKWEGSDFYKMEGIFDCEDVTFIIGKNKADAQRKLQAWRRVHDDEVLVADDDGNIYDEDGDMLD